MSRLQKKVNDKFVRRYNRWDHISKGTGSHSLKTATVKRFLEMDFIENQQMKKLWGMETETLNPVVVMNIRHKIFCQESQKLPQAKFVEQQPKTVHCSTHNIDVEERYIDYQLNLFRKQLKKLHNRKGQTNVLLANQKLPLIPIMDGSAKLANENVITANQGEDNADENIREDAILNIIIRTPSPLTLTEDLLQPMITGAEEHKLQIARELLKTSIPKFCQTSSNTSDDIDSAISDLADEALIEWQEEEVATRLSEKKQSGVITVPKYDVKDEGTIFSSNKKDISAVIGTKNYLSEMCIDLCPTLQQENVSNDNTNCIIEELFQVQNCTNIDIMRKSFLKWIHFTTIEKIEREKFTSRHDRVNMINTFLDNLRKEKKRFCVDRTLSDKNGTQENGKIISKEANRQSLQIAKKQQNNKIKVQQDIIHLQRLKLERQERLILELKLNKLSDESKETRERIKDDLQMVMRYGDPKIKAKVKSIQLVGGLRDENAEHLARLQANGALMVPKFLQSMQDRALERSVRHEQARQRRMQHDAEREAQKFAIEEAKRHEDEEAKRFRIEALNEKRRQEKIMRFLKERDRQRMLELQRRTREFYNQVLRRMGMEGFKRLLKLKKDNLRKCETFRKIYYKREYFSTWHTYCVLLQEQKNMLADDVYYKFLKNRALIGWISFVHYQRSLQHVAVDWHELRLTETMFASWLDHTKRMCIIEDTKMLQGISHHEWHLKWKVLDCWQRLPQIIQLEKDTEERRQRWRMKIWELLPDYKPTRDDFF